MKYLICENYNLSGFGNQLRAIAGWYFLAQLLNRQLVIKNRAFNTLFKSPYSNGDFSYNFSSSQCINVEDISSWYDLDLNSLDVIFIDLSEFINDGEIEQWIWDFGDGNTQVSYNGYAEHSYLTSGTYEASLIVKNIYGYFSDPHIEFIQVGSTLSGDINDDSMLNILDIVMMVNFVLGAQSPNSQQFQSSDMNDDGILNILDVVTLVNIVLSR